MTDINVKTYKLGGGVLLIRDGKVLLGYQTRKYEEPCWATPGGKIDAGESVEQAMIREVFEETGIKVKSLQRLTFFEDLMENVDFISFQFCSGDFDGEPKVMEPNKCKEWKWFSLNELPKNLNMNIKRLLEEGFLHKFVS